MKLFATVLMAVNNIVIQNKALHTKGVIRFCFKAKAPVKPVSSSTVKRGQKVNVIVSGENIVISAKGTLRSDTMIGETANVLCDLTRKEVSGVLVSPSLVKVKI